ncbi:MAG: co-chaperone GroES [Patescibacteria group bacterium]|nr:co-chaperone GroES [Patescibacteria group bacterium]
MTNIKPLGNRILVKQSTEAEVTASGIVLPDTAEKEKKAQGKIVAVGTGPMIAELKLKIGDTVVFGKYAGEEIEIGRGSDKEEYKILYVGTAEDKSDVLAVIE